VPVFENRVDLMVRGVRVFFNVEAGVARNEVAKLVPRSSVSKASGQANAPPRSLDQAGRRIARKGLMIGIKARRQLSRGQISGIRPENVVWIFGSARTGSTWLSRMMGELEGQTVWREPLVGALFGNLYYDRAKHLIGKTGKHYILGDGYRESWLDSIRTFVLKEASGRFPEATGSGNYLVIKEPNGSLGAPLLMEAMPESRMILLVRDPRDVMASTIDARRTGGWQYESRKKWMTESLVDKDPDAFVRDRAENYLKSIRYTKQAYDAHEGRKVLVRYEELRADTLGTMKRIYSDLGISVDEGELARAVKEHSWENIPEEKKGEGKVFRKAKPGGWREDLSPGQVGMVESITAPLLEEFYPDDVP
jgi:Sulfotransferase family